MALFRRNKNDSATTGYYQSPEAENKPMAWLLAIATFVITLLIILVLFFVGKWAWNKISGDNDNQQATQSQPQSEQTNTSGNTDNKESTDTVNGATHVTTDPGPQTSSASTSTPSQAITQPNTGPTELVRTGPDQDL